MHLKLINYWFKKCKIDEIIMTHPNETILWILGFYEFNESVHLKFKIDEIIKTNPNKTISPTLTVAAAQHDFLKCKRFCDLWMLFSGTFCAV